MRLTYASASPDASSSSSTTTDASDPASTSDAAILARVLARRNGTLLPLDRALLIAPQLADGWNAFYGAIRARTGIPAGLRELVMCRVAALNGAWFEWEQHAPLLAAAGVAGLGDDAVDVQAGGLMERIKDRAWTGEGLGERQRAVLEYTDAMTVGCIVRDPLFARLKRLFDEKEIVELTTTIAGYNGVSRFLVALDIGEMAEKYGIDMS